MSNGCVEAMAEGYLSGWSRTVWQSRFRSAKRCATQIHAESTAAPGVSRASPD